MIHEKPFLDTVLGGVLARSLAEQQRRRRSTKTLRSASSVRHLDSRLTTAGAKVRRATFDGREHVVVPVVALVAENVVRPVNSLGAEMVPTAALAFAPSGWNGRPVCAGHPDGGASSANDPGMLESLAFGRLFNTRFEDGRLKTEAWLDPVQARRVGRDAVRVIERCLAGEVVEVSVGCFVSAERMRGIGRDGKPYEYIWTEIVPDHLAMLPEGTEGACSVAAGCGAPRAAQATLRSAVIRKSGEEWCIYSEKGKRLGCYASEAKAEDRLRQIEHFKRRDMGGPGSGNFGHAGRPGQVGGSAPSGEGGGGALTVEVDDVGVVSGASALDIESAFTKTLGVRGYIADTPMARKMGVVALEALTALKARGVMPPSIFTVSHGPGLAPSGVTISYPSRTGAPAAKVNLYLPEALAGAKLEDADEYVAVAFSGKDVDGTDKFAVRSLRDVVVHELAHAAQARSIGTLDMEPLRGDEVTDARSVSVYATKDRSEFVAETFVRLVRGETLSDPVMKLYRKYRGPELN